MAMGMHGETEAVEEREVQREASNASRNEAGEREGKRAREANPSRAINGLNKCFDFVSQPPRPISPPIQVQGLLLCQVTIEIISLSGIPF